MNKEEDILYNQTQEFGRTQFVRELARKNEEIRQLQQENKQLKEIVQEIKDLKDCWFKGGSYILPVEVMNNIYGMIEELESECGTHE